MLYSGRRRTGLMRVPDVRARMISHTGAFLSWGLGGDRGLPRIPRRKVSEGGFAAALREPGAREAFGRWWSAALTVNWPTH